MARKPRPIRIEGDVAYVPLTKGYEAVIDAADVPLVQDFHWRVMEIRRRDGSIRAIYAGSSQRSEGKRQTVYMHRVVLGVSGGFFADHRDRDGLNNRRTNLRTATPTQNAYNRIASRNNTSGAKGVTWNKSLGKWQTSIRASGKSFHLGTFTDFKEATAAYAKACADLHGDFGRVA